jgi:putative membrane protein
MATAGASGPIKQHPVAVTALLSVVGYTLVVGTFAGVIPSSVFPELSVGQVTLLSDAIAVVNTVATVSLVAGWRWIRRDEVRKHAAAMSTAFALILVFLVLYLTKIGGGGTKLFEGPQLVYYAYLTMLAVHVVLSIVSVPVVLYAIVLGLTHTPAELRETAHARVGRVAAGAWILSLSLGVLTYLMLNHLYDSTFADAAMVVVPAVVG